MLNDKNVALQHSRNRKILKLSQILINQIAAGEVVERPASVLKELVENSIDAGAKNIEISIAEGGKAFLCVKDDGCGIHKDELNLALERHATSKLELGNLFDINTFGFRGEALASISSIARVILKSSYLEDCAYAIESNENGISAVFPIGENIRGTKIEVSDLFYATPARLKFLKSTATEADACYETFINFALCYPNISFKYIDNGRLKSEYKATSRLERIKDVLGEEFIENTRLIEKDTNKISLSTYLGVPNFNKSTSSHQRIYINGRFVKDKFISSIVRSAYKDVIPSGRFPVFIMFLSIDNALVDVNVHPAKTEVRFRNLDDLKTIIFSSIKQAIYEDIGNHSAFSLDKLGLSSILKRSTSINHDVINSSDNKSTKPFQCSQNPQQFLDKHFNNLVPFKKIKQAVLCSDIKQIKSDEKTTCICATENLENNGEISKKSVDLGNAIAQIDNKYIISKNENEELIIVDQHAVCERMLLEKLLNRESLDSQQLLLPEIVVLTASKVELLQSNKETLNNLGVYYEKISFDTICLRAIPSIFDINEPKEFILDIIDELCLRGNVDDFSEKIRYVFSTIACHNSIRAGKSLTKIEMDSILRQAESSRNIAQCCHGRPSYIKLSGNLLDKLFERV